MAKLIYFDLVKRKSIPLTDQIKQKMLTRWIDVDE